MTQGGMTMKRWRVAGVVVVVGLLAWLVISCGGGPGDEPEVDGNVPTHTVETLPIDQESATPEPVMAIIDTLVISGRPAALDALRQLLLEESQLGLTLAVTVTAPSQTSGNARDGAAREFRAWLDQRLSEDAPGDGGLGEDREKAEAFVAVAFADHRLDVYRMPAGPNQCPASEAGEEPFPIRFDDEGPNIADYRRCIYRMISSSLRSAEPNSGPGGSAPEDGDGIVAFVDAGVPMVNGAIIQTDPSNDGIVPTGVGTPTSTHKFSSTDFDQNFLEQWALGAGGINMPSAPTFGTPTSNGSEVSVGLFDSWSVDFGTPSGSLASASIDMAHWSNGAVVTRTRSIGVVDPSQLADYPDLPSGTSSDNRQEHALFSASLIDAVAPAADLEVVRVVDDAGAGTIPSLVGGLHWYLLEHGVWDASGSVDVLPAHVLHVGVGSRKPADPAVIGSANEVPTQMATAGAAAATLAASVTDNTRKGYLQAYATEMATGAGTGLASLRAPIRLAERVGAVVVAPAGNGSQSIALPIAEVPANYDTVLGVMAVDGSKAKACFSGSLEGTTGITPGLAIAAPGGRANPTACSPASVNRPCWDCKQSHVLGRVSSDVVTGAGEDRGYALWVGTSFSTAFTSGAAALARQKCQSATPDGIRDLLRQSALDEVGDTTLPDGVGVLDVAAMLQAPCP